jgi:hypothetical protein
MESLENSPLIGRSLRGVPSTRDRSGLGLQSDGSARLGWTNGLHVTLDFENIDKYGRGSRLWTFAHEAYHAMENRGMVQSFVTRLGKELAGDVYAHKVTGEPYTEQMAKYWRYVAEMDRLEQNMRPHIKKVMERRGR